MATLAVAEHIHAPPEGVFALASDPAAAARYCPGIERIERLTAGPLGVGARWRETRRGMGTEVLEITRFDPPRAFSVQCESCGCQYVMDFSFEPALSGTRVSLRVTTRPRTRLARLMAPVAAWMAGSMRRQLAADLEALKRAAERGDAPPAD